MKLVLNILAGILMCTAMLNEALAGSGVLSVSDYGSIQEAIDANPGRKILVPEGIYEITEEIRINEDGAGLYGFGTIVQKVAKERIIKIEHAEDVLIRDLILMRPEGEQETGVEAVLVEDATRVRLEGLRVMDNHTDASAVFLLHTTDSNIQGCEIVNYKKIDIDSRMNEPDLYNYAFRCINGTGITVKYSTGAQILNNRVIERRLSATKENMERYGLGKVTERGEKIGPLAPDTVEKEGYVDSWHQGSAIVVSNPSDTRKILIQGNQIENCAQGIDLHCDHVIVSQNIVEHSYMGMKAMHGSKNVLIDGNQFIYPAKYGILLRPGSSSHPATPAKGEEEEQAANVQAGIIISNNMITDVGRGNEGWRIYSSGNISSAPVGIKLGSGPLERNPVMRDVVIQGNIVYDSGRDGALVDGEVKPLPPRFEFAVWFDENPVPENVHISGNIFHPGEYGISNREITP